MTKCSPGKGRRESRSRADMTLASIASFTKCPSPSNRQRQGMDVLEALFTSPPAHVSSSATKTLLFRSTSSSSSSSASHPQSINPPSTKPSLLTTNYHTHHQSHHVRIRYVITTPSQTAPPHPSIHSLTRSPQAKLVTNTRRSRTTTTKPSSPTKSSPAEPVSWP